MQPSLKDTKVLVVDDELDILRILRMVLERVGARVLTATNGQEGFEMAFAEQPNFIISDISMPKVDGWEMTEMLKKNPSTQSIPVIALTAHGVSGYRDRAYATGFHNFLVKPVRPSTFIYELLAVLNA